jgi:hypothetical protein
MTSSRDQSRLLYLRPVQDNAHSRIALRDEERVGLCHCAGIEAPGTSLHPQIRVSTKDPEDAPCEPGCFVPEPNSVQEYTANSYYTSFGDVFTVNIPQLGGVAEGRTHLQGRMMIQFGEPNADGNVPFAISTLPPGGLLAPIPDAPAPLNLFKITMLGHNERLFFPNFTYITADPVLLEDGFDPSIGLLNPSTGAVIGDLLYRGVPAQSLFSAIINLNITRIPLDTFRHVGPARFSVGPNGENVFHYDGKLPLTFDTLLFPSPNYDNPNEAFTAGPGSLSILFCGFRAYRSPTTLRRFARVVVKTSSVPSARSSRIHTPFPAIRPSTPMPCSSTPITPWAAPSAWKVSPG